MFLVQINRSRFLYSAALLFTFSVVAYGDSLTTRDSVIYGTIITIDKNRVSFAEGCNKQYLRNISLKDIRRMERNSQCSRPLKPVSVGGFDLDTCVDASGKNQLVFIINFGKKQKAYASELELKENGIFVVHIVNSHAKLRGPINKVVIISRVCAERKDIPVKPEFPKEFSEF